MARDFSKNSAPLSPFAPRRSANYSPTLWDDNYIQSLPDASLDETELNLWKKLKVNVRHLFDHNSHKNLIKLLEDLHDLRQLGISYHFVGEINNVLNFICSSTKSIENILEDGLYGYTLIFMLLREYGIKNPNLSEVIYFDRFNKCEIFSVPTMNDIKKLLCLYEASYLTIEGEDNLEELRKLATKCLRNFLKEPIKISSILIEQISHALELPIHWRMPRLHTRWFIDVYEKQERMNPIFLQFAKLDFNMVQIIYMREMKELSRWWSNLGLNGNEFHFARDRMMENYFWSVGCSFEPHFWRCRMELSKMGCLLTTIDDIYDVYGSLEELVLFTNAITEWKFDATNMLPHYMEITLVALFNTMNDISNAMQFEKGLCILSPLKQLWRDQCKSYLLEAIWYNTGYTPTLTEYMDNACISMGGSLIINGAYCLSDELTTEALDRIDFHPNFTYLSSYVARLYDDLGTSIDELQRGDVPKSIQCYMKEKTISELAARDHIKKLIKKSWKKFNGEYISKFYLEESCKRYALNFPRMAQCMYQYGDGHGKPDQGTKDKIISLLLKPISL